MTKIHRDGPRNDGIPQQHRLGVDDIDYKYKKHLTLDFGITGQNQDILEFYLSPNEDTGPMDIHVDQDMLIIITLSDKQWYWSTDHYAITTKYNRTAFYKRLRYKVADDTWLSWQEVRGNPNYRALKTVAFQAKWRGQGARLEGHGINFNVDLMIDGNDKLKLPIMIDPDVINPKPPNSN